MTILARSTQNAHEGLTRAFHSLLGLSCGDAFGERFFRKRRTNHPTLTFVLHPEVAQSLIAQRAVPSPPWRYTDDTVVAIAVAETLEEFGEIQEASLAANFGTRYVADPQRGYGAARYTLLPELAGAPST